MATSVGTSPTEVRVEIDTELSDSDINDILDRVEREINRAYSSGTSDFDDSQHRKDFEAALAALRIAEGRDRRANSADVGDTSITYETEEIAQLQKRVRRDDPGSQFGTDGMVTRDTDRYATSTDF